jgi:glycosyltransferase involved in cell wall biosynthesis
MGSISIRSIAATGGSGRSNPDGLPTMNSAPLVSIVIPCYRGERYLPEALRSCLAQTYSNLEVIVVDDASPDRCGEIAESFAVRDPRVRVVRLPQNTGVAGAFNAGFDRAQGEFMARLAQDDFFDNGAVALMVRYLTEHGETGLVYCDEKRVDENGKALGDISRPEPSEALAGGNKIGFCVMWRREVWEKVGKFDSRYDAAEDYDYWLRVKDKYRIAKCPGGPQLFVRIHEQMGSRVYSAAQEIRAAQIQARHCCWLESRKVLAKGYFNAAYHCRNQGRQGQALKHLLTALAYWPFDAKLYRLFVGIGLRKFRVRKPT